MMKIIFIYYASALGLIRFLGIGVGNEDARATTIFSSSVLMLISVIIKFFGLNIFEINKLFVIFLVIMVYFSVYLYFTRNKEKIDIILLRSSKSEKIKFGLISLVVFFLNVITFFNLYHGN